MRTIFTTMAVALLAAGTAAAADCSTAAPGYCSACGCGVRKMCRVVCDVEEVKSYCWEVECEEFCVPLPGCCKLGCGKGGKGCGGPWFRRSAGRSAAVRSW